VKSVRFSSSLVCSVEWPIFRDNRTKTWRNHSKAVQWLLTLNIWLSYDIHYH